MHTVSEGPSSDRKLFFGFSSTLKGLHLSQRSGSEVTLPLQSAASVSESSSHHTNGSSSTGCGKQGRDY